MAEIISSDLQRAINEILEHLPAIDQLYPIQHELLTSLTQNDNIFFTSSTNSGKTLPTVIYPSLVKKLSEYGYSFPSHPKVLYITPLNSLKLSQMNNVKGLGIDCEAVTSENVKTLLNSKTSVLFISPEVLKLPHVIATLLSHRSSFVLKVVDEAHLGKNILKKCGCIDLFGHKMKQHFSAHINVRDDELNKTINKDNDKIKDMDVKGIKQYLNPKIILTKTNQNSSEHFRTWDK